MEKFIQKNQEYLYVVFRVIIGLLFLLHGIMKVGGLMGDKIPVVSLIALAGVIELVAGILILVGLVTRYAAIISAVQMLVAYFMVHAKGGLNPLANQGELAVLFFAAFLAIIVHGAGKFSLDHKLKI